MSETTEATIRVTRPDGTVIETRLGNPAGFTVKFTDDDGNFEVTQEPGPGVADIVEVPGNGAPERRHQVIWP